MPFPALALLQLGYGLYSSNKAGKESEEQQAYDRLMHKQDTANNLSMFNQNLAQSKESSDRSQGLTGLNFLAGQRAEAQKRARENSFWGDLFNVSRGY